MPPSEPITLQRGILLEVVQFYIDQSTDPKDPEFQPVCTFCGERGAWHHITWYEDGEEKRHLTCYECLQDVFLALPFSTGAKIETFPKKMSFRKEPCLRCLKRKTLLVSIMFPTLKDAGRYLIINGTLYLVNKDTEFLLALCTEHLKELINPASFIMTIKSGAK